MDSSISAHVATSRRVFVDMGGKLYMGGKGCTVRLGL